MRNTLLLCRGHLGGTDIHAAVNLHRIAGDDLTVQTLRHRYRERGFAAGGGAEYRYQLVAHRLFLSIVYHMPPRKKRFRISALVSLMASGRPWGQVALLALASRSWNSFTISVMFSS